MTAHFRNSQIRAMADNIHDNRFGELADDYPKSSLAFHESMSLAQAAFDASSLVHLDKVVEALEYYAYREYIGTKRWNEGRVARETLKLLEPPHAE